MARLLLDAGARGISLAVNEVGVAGATREFAPHQRHFRIRLSVSLPADVPKVARRLPLSFVESLSILTYVSCRTARLMPSLIRQTVMRDSPARCAISPGFMPDCRKPSIMASSECGRDEGSGMANYCHHGARG